MATNCSWCNKFIPDDASVWCHKVIVEGIEKQSHQKFCSLKCSHEYPYQATPEVDGGWCFVATAVFNDYNHPVVWDLRIFRDNYLEKRSWGRKFINFYYFYSPRFAYQIKKSKFLRLTALMVIIKPLHFFVKTFNLGNN